MANSEPPEASLRQPSSPPAPIVPPPSEVNIEYSGLDPTASGGRDNYFPSRTQSFQHNDSPPPSSRSIPQAPKTCEQVNSAATLSRARTSSTSKSNLDNFPQKNDARDVRQPGATEALRAKLAEHRNSMSAAYSDDNPSRIRDFAFDNVDGNDSKTPPPPVARHATFDQTLSQNANRPVPEGRQRLLHKAHSITAPQTHAPPSVFTPVPPVASEVEGRTLPSVLEQYRAGRVIPDIVTTVDPSISKKVYEGGQPIPKSEIQEAVNNTKKPFYKRGLGTRKRLLGAVGTSQAGSSMSMKPLSAGSSGPAPVSAGNMADPHAPAQPSFNLGGAPHKPSMARQRTKAVVPVGIAVPNTQRKREPTWSKKARERPLYSLGKPLPTHEEVQAQRAWQEQIERLKEMYPEAEPPEPPPLPSQQGVASGLQIDKAQLKDIIRTAILEYKRYEAGELDLDAVSAISPRDGSMSSTRRRRSTVLSNETSFSPRRKTFGSLGAAPLGFGMSRMDSAVIEEEDGPPLEPLYPFTSRTMSNAPKERKASKADSTGRGPPAVSNRDGQEPHRSSVLGRSQRQAHTSDSFSRGGRQSTGAHSDAGMPANTEEPLTDEDVQNKREEETAADGTPGVQKNPRASVYSRDHETEGNWSEEEATEMDPDETAEIGDAGKDEDHIDEEEDDDYPNILAKWKVHAREPFAEFLGAFVLAVIGVGASAQAALSSDPNIQPTGTGAASTSVNLSAPLAWGAGVAMSVYIAGGISGGHISPAITIVLAVFRGFPWKRVPSYIAGQLLGFTAGSAVAYGLYRHAISIYEGGPNLRTIGVGGTANFFATYPLEYVSNANAFFQEFTNVALLLILVLAIGDADNVPPPAGLNPIILMFAIMAIGLSLGLQSSYALNPARDLGPRLVSWMAGYGTGVWNYRDQYWLWGPWAADITGGLFGALLYDTLIFMGRESPMNKRWHVPFISKARKTEEMSRKWQGWKMHQKARRAGWRSRMVSDKEVPAESKEVV